MNLTVHNFLLNSKINKKYICENQGGNNITPEISWTKVKNAVSYALIIEDPDARHSLNVPPSTFIHWYIPYISKDIQKIDSLLLSGINNLNINSFNKHNSIKLFNGKNTMGQLGYHGPCAPDRTGIHRYIFTIYALNGLLEITENNIQIKDSNDFCNILKKAGITILNQESLTFRYSYKNFSS
jgi:Raf kinase inhibitor-like YbhB/YbcL family protein